nr:MAG TPA: hypothetical protein [Caudoviricetes sp.]
MRIPDCPILDTPPIWRYPALCAPICIFLNFGSFWC